MLSTVDVAEGQVHVLLLRPLTGGVSQEQAQHPLDGLRGTCPRGHFCHTPALQLRPAYVTSGPFKVLSRILLSTDMKEYTLF